MGTAPHPAPALDLGIEEAAMDLALMRYARDDAGASVTLSDSYDADHPRKDGEESEDNLDRYFRQEWAPKRIESAWNHLRASFDAAPEMTLWRNVCIAGDPLEGFAEHYRSTGWVGIFWASDRDAAHPHNSSPEGPPGYLLEARVTIHAVDWVTTLASYAHPDWVGEEEIRLLPDAEVTLVSITPREGWLRRGAEEAATAIDIGDWAGARLKAGDPSMTPGWDDPAPAGAPAP